MTDSISDLLQGAEEIAGYLLGDPSRRTRIYHLIEQEKLPVFRLGVILCARKSSLLAWIEDQERQAMNRKQKSA